MVVLKIFSYSELSCIKLLPLETSTLKVKMLNTGQLSMKLAPRVVWATTKTDGRINNWHALLPVTLHVLRKRRCLVRRVIYDFAEAWDQI